MACPQLGSSLSNSSISCPLPAAHLPHRSSISSDVWRVAEERIEEILCVVQPSVISQDRRNEVIEYIQRVIGSCLGTEIFPYGSVPLRTYLPDGDIDLTLICNQNAVDDLVRKLFNMVDERCKDPEFLIKDVQVVEAQVKIVKCVVKGISLDLSFNQVSGISALCFIEQVDRMIGREHLFKRSIILIKAWCLYESRVLGSYNGLISTYGLQILVLYIINIFHSSLDGPLSVLHKFLDYFGKFDWQSCCITLYGPALISSLPNIVVVPPENGNRELLVGKEFVDSYKEQVSSGVPETEPQRPFLIKNLNIVDPLNDKNNLGRSVSKGNFLRIKFAFCYGAEKIREILTQQRMNRIGQELEHFFKNTLDRNGRGERPDMEEQLFPAFGTGRFVTPSLDGEIDCFYSRLMHIRQQQQQQQQQQLQLGGYGYSYGLAAAPFSSEQKRAVGGQYDEYRNKQKVTKGGGYDVPRGGKEVRSGPYERQGSSKGTGGFIPFTMENGGYVRRSDSWCVRGGSSRNIGDYSGASIMRRNEDEAAVQRRSVSVSVSGSGSGRRSLRIRTSSCSKAPSLPVILEQEDDDTSLAAASPPSQKCVAKPYQLEDDMDFPPLSSSS